MVITPGRETFLKLAEQGLCIPVEIELLSDIETPLSTYWKLAFDEPYSFLLESVTGGEQLARYSILGVRPSKILRTRGPHFWIESRDQTERGELGPGTDPLDLLKSHLRPLRALETPGLPKFFGGAVGMLGYDLVRFFERLPDRTKDDLGWDDLVMMIAQTVVVFDHAKNRLRLIHLAEPSEAGYATACAELSRLVERLQGPLPPLPESAEISDPVFVRGTTSEQFQAGVAQIKEYIAAGDGVQMVLSQRFQTAYSGHPVTLYRALRSMNPSPYLFLLRMNGSDLVGASPELLVSLSNGQARVRPIAGTRWRGATPEEDDRLAEELLADQKERAEHVMLVDLGRNDLGRVCDYGSVQVRDLMIVERYSHVMHIVSDVAGTMSPGLDAMDLVRATFPAGTVSGAPKVRAMEIIEELEPTRRGPYAGAVGYFGVDGDLDLAITIRTISLQAGVASIQAGAGIVFDSVPASEDQECLNKAQAALRALEMARRGLNLG